MEKIEKNEITYPIKTSKYIPCKIIICMFISCALHWLIHASSMTTPFQVYIIERLEKVFSFIYVHFSLVVKSHFLSLIWLKTWAEAQ